MQKDKTISKEQDSTTTKIDPSNASTIPKFMDSLPIPPVARPIEGHKCDYDYDSELYYNIVMRETKHKFHELFPYSKIWGYDGMYPGPTIEAKKDVPILVEWSNDLPNKHFLPVDKTLHGSSDSPEVRTVVHLHGANVDPDSDGYPEAWYTRDYRVFGPKFKREVYEYTNHQPGTTLWYHDHSLGITRLNVYAGLAGFYILRDSLEERLNLPKGKYEIPIIVQDKTFNSDGSIFYPSTPTPPPPVPLDIPNPSIVPFFLGNTIVANGKLWPHLDVEPRKYRFRILNGSNRRSYNFKLSKENMEFIQIGTDGGLRHHSKEISYFILQPSERIDLIIDFSNYKDDKILLLNTGESVDGVDDNTNVIMQFRVVKPLSSPDVSVIPQELTPLHEINKEFARKTRDLSLNFGVDHYGRGMLLLGDRMWNEPATEKPAFDSIEVWNIINTTFLDHPIHVHLVQFQILSRRSFDAQKYLNEGILDYGNSPIEDPLPFEEGFKDTIRAEANKVTTIVMHFKQHYGDYVWHCHFLEHEDHDMMRPLRIVQESAPLNS